MAAWLDQKWPLISGSAVRAESSSEKVDDALKNNKEMLPPRAEKQLGKPALVPTRSSQRASGVLQRHFGAMINCCREV